MPEEAVGTVTGAVSPEPSVPSDAVAPIDASTTPVSVTPATADPFEGKSAAEIREALRTHPNPEVQSALKRESQSRADSLLQERTKQAEAASQLQRTIEQVQSMTPEEFHKSVLEQLGSTAQKQNVSAETLKAARYQTYNEVVSEAIDGLGKVTAEEQKAIDPTTHQDYPSWRQAYLKVVEDRAVERVRGKVAKEEAEAAKLSANAKAREEAPTQDIDQTDRQSRRQDVDVSDLKGTGNIYEALRRMRQASPEGNWPRTQ